MNPTTFLLALCLAVAASAEAAPGDRLSYADARHLLLRTGFAPTEREVESFVGKTRRAAVDALLQGTRSSAVTPVPAPLVDPARLILPRGPNATPEERKAFVREQVQEGLLLRGWWVQEMLTTPSPLTERMTLFWHDHFVSAQPKVRLTRLMLGQNVTLRADALGSFATLLHAIAKDPAMIVYLDGAQNRKGAPNENFAREVMELFTLGEGHYGEGDVKEAARAFTGWSVDRATGQFVFRRAQHDDGLKTVLGQTGRFDGDDVLDILLARPETATFVVAKLWREFVAPEVDDRAVARIAGHFRTSRYDIKTALRDILEDDAFYAPEHRGVLVKSPAELVVGALRQLDLRPGETVPFAVAAAGMGQNLFSPPNVKGWPGGDTWINTTTLLARKQFIERITREQGFDAPAPATAVATAMETPRQVQDEADMQGRPRVTRAASLVQRGVASLHFDAAAWSAQLEGRTTPDRNSAALRLLLAAPAQQPIDVEADPRHVVRAALLDAAYQLK